MRDHQTIDQRSIAMAREIVKKIDEDPQRGGLGKARTVCTRWRQMHENRYLDAWAVILSKSWEDVRELTRHQLEHIVRASGAIAEVEELIVLGSQVILGSFAEPPPQIAASLEADVYPPEAVERVELGRVESAIDELPKEHAALVRRRLPAVAGPQGRS